MRPTGLRGAAIKSANRSATGKNKTNTPRGISFSPQLPLFKKYRGLIF